MKSHTNSMRTSLRTAAGVAILLAGYGWTQIAWEPAVMLSPDDDETSAVDQFSNSIAVGNGMVHVVWSDYRHGGDFHTDVYCRRSSNAGQSWEQEVRLTNNSASSSDASIASDGDYVHVAFRRGDDSRPHYIRSSNGGRTWGEERTVHDGVGSRYDSPVVATGGGAVHLVWSNDSTLYYCRSVDNGDSWGERRALVTGAERFSGSMGRAVVSEGTVVVAYVLDDAVNVVRSTDGGTTWSDAYVIENTVEPDPAVYSSFDVAAEGNRVYVAANSGGTTISPGAVYVHVSSDNGGTFGEATEVTAGRYAFWNPRIVASGGVVHAAWYQHFDSRGARYRASYDAGVSWAQLDTVDTTRALRGVAIAADGGRVHLLTEVPEGEVMYRRAEVTTSVEHAAPQAGSRTSETRLTRRGDVAVLDVPEATGGLTLTLLNLRGEVVSRSRVRPRSGQVTIELPSNRTRTTYVCEVSGPGIVQTQCIRLVGF